MSNSKYYSHYLYIINEKNLPDKDIELFWYNYKNFIINTYHNHFSKISDNFAIKNEIDNISIKLNDYQIQKNWEQIISIIYNFQLYMILFILKTLKKYKQDYIIIHKIYSLLIKFIKRWNNINFNINNDINNNINNDINNDINIDNSKIISLKYKIPLSNLNNIEDTKIYLKICIIIAMICKNIKIRKCCRFMIIVNIHYNIDIDINLWNKNDYSMHNINICPTIINSFLSKCISVFLFNDNGCIDASTSILDYISCVYNYKHIWYIKKNIDFQNISTKKFCIKFKNILILEDF